jgi:hypothetical protein
MSLFTKYLNKINESIEDTDLNILVDMSKIGKFKNSAFKIVWDSVFGDEYGKPAILKQIFDYFHPDVIGKAPYKVAIESSSWGNWQFIRFLTEDENKISSVLEVLKDNNIISFPATKNGIIGFIIKQNLSSKFYKLLEEKEIDIDKIIREE